MEREKLRLRGLARLAILAVQFEIRGSDEYITTIGGTTTKLASNDDRVVVESLTFYTNETHYEPYGKTSGLPFTVPIENGEVVGFFGHQSDYINAIGIYVKSLN
ncbi:hypothetical protein EZV62_008335 [Acer yangbiense]|uniref:Jacalin-type lectin domain-containing protein n=1 Tax=Acer yangbiense TaxID=1000413 RepID=A0A5C7ICJ2_9ROSI|nr:hypothetical protein EZV62_008335 [Acer yangbiense]